MTSRFDRYELIEKEVARLLGVTQEELKQFLTLLEKKLFVHSSSCDVCIKRDEELAIAPEKAEVEEILKKYRAHKNEVNERLLGETYQELHLCIDIRQTFLQVLCR